MRYVIGIARLLGYAAVTALFCAIAVGIVFGMAQGY